eukprot:m.403761 g.403761  ORF g.403761 m.403761 type:complete len:439 (+) comp21194_c0_seq16:117-1433(+)
MSAEQTPPARLDLPHLSNSSQSLHSIFKEIQSLALEGYNIFSRNMSASNDGPPSAAPISIEVPDSFKSEEYDRVQDEIMAMIKDKAQMQKLWESLDVNDNGGLSLAEIDKWVEQSYPLLNNKRAMMRAYQKTTMEDGDKDPWVQRYELKALILNLFYFNKIESMFKLLDKDGDHRLSFEEFVAGIKILGMDLKREDAWREYCIMDDDRAGMVLFSEFCHWVAAKMCPEGFEEYYESRSDLGKSGRQQRESNSTGNVVHGKVRGGSKVDTHADIHTTKYDGIESELLQRLATKASAKKLFNEIDDNHSGKISRKEFVRWVKGHYALLNDEKLITRAFRRTTAASEDGDKFVQPDEFRDLIMNLFFQAKLTFAFSKIDKNHDGKVSFAEFCKGLLWVGLTLSTEAARTEYDAMDSAGGGDGNVDFDEFVAWVVSKKVPVD